MYMRDYESYITSICLSIYKNYEIFVQLNLQLFYDIQEKKNIIFKI